MSKTRPESERDPEELDSEEQDIRAREERLPKLVPGSVIPSTRLQIVRWLGQGGMGVVFEVRHLDIERRYAAKLLHYSESLARMRRFRKEARTISQIGSPWIVEIFDFKELPDGRLMYLMELVEGPSLYAAQRKRADEIEGLPCEPSRLIGLARQVCKGLQDAHEVGFIHRDVKPENIMLGVDADGREHVKIVDFGLAALLEGPKDANRGGTPAYMSPEQCQGRNTDARADIYSLGVTLYELACGRLPFIRDNEQGLRQDHVRAVPTPPSKLVEGGSLPPGFDEVILRCMAKKPAARYASATELEAALIELQLALRLRSAWDDLPAPALEDERRQRRLDEGLAQLRSDDERGNRRRLIVGAALVAFVGAGAVVGWMANEESRVAVMAEDERQLDALRTRARLAADHARWIYPTSAEPEAETAYRVLLELEGLDMRQAGPVGQGLREEFAGTLVALGDNYWDREGGRTFASEFYAQALVFETGLEDAGERAGLSPMALLQLRERAAAGDFNGAEIEAVMPLASLAATDPDLRAQGLLAAREGKRLSPRSAADIDRLIVSLGHELPEDGDRGAGVVGHEEPSPAASEGETDEGETDEGETDEGDGLDPDAEHDGPAATHEDGGSRDGGAMAKATIKSAQSAYNAGRSGDAEKLFHGALKQDKRNVAALVGLHYIYFDRGKYRQALDYAKRAVALRPKRKDLHMFVGDSCMKVLDYSCARTHYEKAKSLGEAGAAQRLRMLNERVGGGN